MRNISRNTLVCVFAAVAGCTFATSASAQMRTAKACALLNPEFNIEGKIDPPSDICYSGFKCEVGMRGAWIDFTDEVTVTSLRGNTQLSAAGTLQRTGTSDLVIGCRPAPNRSGEGFVVIDIVDLSGQGRLRVTALRPGPMGVGRHSDHFDFEVRDGSRYLEMYPERELSARVGQTKTIEISGRGLRSLRLKPQSVAQAYTTATAARAPRMAAAAAAIRAQVGVQAPAALLGKTATVRALSSSAGTSPQPPSAPAAPASAPTPEVMLIGATQLMVRLQIKFDRQGIFSLEDYLEFADGESHINRALGWPLIDVKP